MRLLPAVLALALAALPLAAETPPAEPRPLDLPGDRDVTDPASGAVFRLTEVTDQRCPHDVECYWEGMMRVGIAVQLASGEHHEVILCNLCDEGGRTAELAGITLRFEGLEPSTAALAERARLPVLQDYTARIALSGP